MLHHMVIAEINKNFFLKMNPKIRILNLPSEIKLIIQKLLNQETFNESVNLLEKKWKSFMKLHDYDQHRLWVSYRLSSISDRTTDMEWLIENQNRRYFRNIKGEVLTLY